MSLQRSDFAPHFEEIRAGEPAFGQAALLPWDSEIFGFPVASYRLAPEFSAVRARLAAEFHSWMTRRAVSLCACAIPAADACGKAVLPELGFRFVDVGLEARLPNLQTARLPEQRIGVRLAAPEDGPALEALAARSFQHGRYFADALFPAELAQRRYQRWMAHALASQDCVYVLGEDSRIDGFLHLVRDGQTADLRLAAVAPEVQTTGLGVYLYVSVFHELKKLGVRRIVTSISAANTAVLNLYATSGFRFSNPEAIYHWHAECPA